MTVLLFEGIRLLVLVVLLPCVTTDATLNAEGFCEDIPAATAGEDQEKLAFRQILPPPLLYPPRFRFEIPK